MLADGSAIGDDMPCHLRFFLALSRLHTIPTAIAPILLRAQRIESVLPFSGLPVHCPFLSPPPRRSCLSRPQHG